MIYSANMDVTVFAFLREKCGLNKTSKDNTYIRVVRVYIFLLVNRLTMGGVKIGGMRVQMLDKGSYLSSGGNS